jgi:UPF0755 protein
MKNGIARALVRTWCTGVLYILAGLGYLFYGLLWTIRLMQKFKTVCIPLALAVACAAVLAAYLFVPRGGERVPVEIVIERGQSIHSIARGLKFKRVVPSSTAFVLWMKLRGLEKKVKTGKVLLVSGEGIVSAARKILHAQPVEVDFTVPEGLTMEQTAAVVGKALGVDSLEFLAACADTGRLRRLGIPARTAEGYLFPDTYRFSPGVKAFEIVKRMIEHAAEQYARLVRDSTQGSLSRHEVFTLASIVEKEAAVDSERPLVAGVFYNRLEKHMTLGADPTVRYILRKFSGPLLVSELAVNSPYNTRRFGGLPPGPICSPGVESLKAALFPAKTKDLYFVAKWDGSGAHDFSITGEEHERKKMRIRRMNELRKVRRSGG